MVNGSWVKDGREPGLGPGAAAHPSQPKTLPGAQPFLSHEPLAIDNQSPNYYLIHCHSNCH